jgi:type IV pilus assembly protein PilC
MGERLINMPNYKYLARSLASGQNVEGNMTVSSQEMLLDRLYFQGLQAIEIKVIEKSFFAKILELGSRVKIETLIIFVRQIGTLLRAGISLFKALEIVINQTEDQRLKKVLEIVKSDLAEGSSLAKSMAAFPGVFSNFFINMVAVGENRGQLEDSFERILVFEEKTREIRLKVVSALTYPIILLVSGITVLIALITLVLPRFVTIFEQSNIELPFITQKLLELSKFVQNEYVLILGVIFSFVAGAILYFQTSQEGKKSRDYLKFKMPIIGTVIHFAALSRFARTLGVLYASGVPLIRALELGKDSVNNLVMAEEIDKVILSVRDGKGIAQPLSRSKIFPPILVNMIGIGEESGSLEDMALKTADFYDQETEYKVKNQMALLEPIALIFIAIIVAIIAASIMLPMLKMASSVRKL